MQTGILQEHGTRGPSEGLNAAVGLMGSSQAQGHTTPARQSTNALLKIDSPNFSRPGLIFTCRMLDTMIIHNTI